MDLYEMFVLQDGRRPLHGAAAGGHLAVVEFLVQSGAAVDEEAKVQK